MSGAFIQLAKLKKRVKELEEENEKLKKQLEEIEFQNAALQIVVERGRLNT